MKMDTLIWILLILFWAGLFWICILATIYVALKINFYKYYTKERKHAIIEPSENNERPTMQFTVKYYQWNELCNIFEVITKKMDKPMLEAHLDLFETCPRDYVLVSIKPTS